MAQKFDERIPRYPDLIWPVFQALKELGGSGNNEDILNRIISDLNLPDEVVDFPHLGSNSLSELAYQAAWARTYLRKYGAVTNSGRSVWAINPDFNHITELNGRDIVSSVNKENRQKKQDPPANIPDEPDTPNIEPTKMIVPEEVQSWRSELANILHSMDPFGFERLAQRILRECGFSQVIVTKKTGDGGIDGTGKLKINGIFSFNIAFQCKRYSGMVGAGAIRDFRGSLTTDIEKGVLITTGTFSKAAKEEAANPGKQQIDLIDGEELINKIAEYGIGVKEVKSYEVDAEFFEKI